MFQNQRLQQLTICILFLFLNSSAWNLLTAEETATVSLVVRYGDGLEKHFTNIPWREGMTISDALIASQKHARGIIYKTRGSGEFTLLTQIDDLENGKNDKYWRFEVNKKEGECSFVLVKLNPQDAVLWKYVTYP
jgi:Domain of unknown function (DUF4430)